MAVIQKMNVSFFLLKMHHLCICGLKQEFVLATTEIQQKYMTLKWVIESI